MDATFENNQIHSSSLPDYRDLTFEPISRKHLSKSVSLWCVGLCIGSAAAIIWINSYDRPALQYSLILFSAILYSIQLFNLYKRQARYGYALRERDLAYKRGFFIEHITIIPFNRVQHVSTSQGVLDKFFGISNLQIFTAGGSGSDINIPGLPPQLARRIKEQIVQKADHAH